MFHRAVLSATWYRHRYPHASRAVLFASLLVIVAATCTSTAYAIPVLDDIIGDPIRAAYDGIGALYDTFISGSANRADDMATTYLTSSFTDLFVLGGALSNGLYSTVQNVADGVVKWVGYPLLAIITIIQLVKVANRMDGNATVPGVKEVLFVLIFYAVFYFLITNAVVICSGIYTVGVGLVQLVAQGAGASGDVNIFSDIAGDNYPLYEEQFGGVLGMFFLLIVSWLITMITGLISFVVVFARSIQIYIYTMFAPISLAMLGSEETRQYGAGFLKNYIGLCLTGAIIVAVLMIGPYVLAAVGTAVTPGAASGAGGTFNVFGALAACIVYVYSLTKSGSWARDILGG